MNITNPNELFTLKDIILTDTNKTILDIPALSIYNGQTCLCGESGSGKTSLLRLLCRLVSPSRGIVNYRNGNLADLALSQIRSEIIYVLQEPFLPDLSLNAFFKQISQYQVYKEKNISSSKTQGKIQENLSSLGMSELDPNKSMGNLSGGEKQKISIAIAMALSPKILLLDEPTSALDTASIDKLIAFFNNHPQTDIISISHEKKWYSNADQVIHMEQGRIL